jgi:hypothetical protein
MTSQSGLETATRASLSARVVARTSLTEPEIGALFALMQEHFHGVDRETFERDLAEKNWVALLSDEEGVVRGFTTFLIYTSAACGRPLTVVCSGDTIVHPSAWGSFALPKAWIRAVYDLRKTYASEEVYWLLLTSGFRTYRFMSVFCRSFYPRFDASTPAVTQHMIDAISRERYGPAYDAPDGLVRFPRPQKLRGGLSTVPEGRVADPHIRFFLDRNPGHGDGDELVSLASLALDNLTPAGRRMLG